MDPNELRKKAAGCIEQAKAIQSILDGGDHGLNAEAVAKQEDKIDGLIEEAESLKAEATQVEESEKKAEQRRQAFASFDPGTEAAAKRKGAGPTGTPNVEVSEPEWTNDPMKGFKSSKEYFGAVIDNSLRPSEAATDERLRYLATAGSDEQSAGSDPYGAFLVPEGMSPDIKSVGYDANPLIGSVTNVPMESPSVNVLARVDKNHSSSVSGGLTVSRRSETAAISSSRMELEKVKLEATGLFGLAYSTEELMERSPRSVAALLGAGFSDEFPAKIMEEMLTGTGVGQLEGVLNSPAAVTVDKEGSQSADTIVANNILKMRQRAWRYSQCVWLANHDTYLQLIDLQIESTNNAGAYWLFRPGNGVDVPDTLLGRPIYFSEFAETLGDKGDIQLINPTQYLYGVYQPLRSAESMHVRFLNHERAFKFWTENAGAGWWRSALTPKKGANTLSPFVNLAARA